MNYGRRPLPSDDEGLQADVMRFMAIIAFCLIAILALVRNAEPEVSRGAAAVESQVEDTMDNQQASRPDRAAERGVPPRGADPVPVEPVVTPVDASPAEEGLSLRFASDRDFRRLVNKGQLEVFAFRAGDVRKLAPGLAFEPSPAPGQVHELLPATIPALIMQVFQAAHADPAAYRWGIRMPERMEAQIARHLQTETRGSLVIDRYGDVRHGD